MQTPTGKEANWVPNGSFKALAHFYGPKKPLVDRTVKR